MGASSIGVGVVGCGWAGKNAATQITKVDRAHLVGICDVDAEAAKAAAEEYGVPAFTDYEALLDADGLGAVAIGSPQFAHHEQVLAAAARGKHIFCEKPMALTVADCDEMIAAADKADVKFCVGQVLRLLAQYAKTAELIESRQLGAPQGVAVTRASGNFANISPTHWRSKQELSGGLLFEVNVHELDFMRSLCGEPEEIFASAQTVTDSVLDYPDLWHVQIKFRDGAIGLLRASRSHLLGEHYFTVQCPQGTISNNNAERALRLRQADETELTVSKEELEQMENGFFIEFRSWIEAIHDGSPMIVDASDGRQAVAMAEAAIESARSGKPCPVSPLP